MNSIWKVGAATVTVALLGGFYLGRVASDPGPLPAVGQPVTVGSTVEPTPAAETPTLRPRRDPTTTQRPRHTRENEVGDDHGDNGDGDDNRGRGRGRGRGGDDDVETISPSPSVVTPDDDDDEGFDDHGGDREGSNSGPG